MAQFRTVEMTVLNLNDIHYKLIYSEEDFTHLTLRQLMSYIYGAPILDVSRSHTTTQYSRQDSSGRVIS